MNTTHQIDTAAQLLAAVTRQTELLQDILNHLQQPRLGFSDSAAVTRIYCNRQHGSLWYRLDNDRNPVPITSTALTGHIVGLEFPRVERRGKESIKLQATLRADTLYVLEAGYESHFSKGLLMAIASMTPYQLSKPVTLAPAPGDDDAVLFCRVWQDSAPVRAHYDDSTDWREVARRAMALMKNATP